MYSNFSFQRVKIAPSVIT